MTISTTIIKNSFSGDGSTTAFTYSFPINSTSEITVIIKASTGVETVKTITTHYTVADAGANGGTVTFTSGNIPASGETILLFRNTTKNQVTDLIENDPFLAESLEAQFDNLQMQVQEVSEAVDRSFKVAKSNTITNSETTASASARANKILSFDASGNVEATALNNLDTLTEMTDVTLSSPADNEVLAFDSGTAHFINQTPAEASLVSLTGTETLTNKTLTSPVINTGVSGTAILDEDNLASDSATQLATQQSIKAYVDATVTAEDLDVSDGSSAIAIDLNSEVLGILGGTGLTSAASGNNVTLTVDAAQTGITSLLATDIKIGEDDQTKVDFETADTINFYAGNEKQLVLTDGALTPGTNAIVDLGTDALEFKDGYFDGTLEADAITIAGTALNTVIAGVTVTNATNATNAVNSTHVSVADNENTNEENLITFIEDTSATGNVGLESDGDFAYNPSTGTVSATIFKGNIDAVDGDFDGTLEADAITVGGTALASVIAGTTVNLATLASTVTITDNENTNENNAIIFTAGGDLDGGNLGLESDGDLKYNPSTGTLSVPNVSVSGTFSTVNSVTMDANNAVIFEGSTADAHETTLTSIDATGDRTISLPNVSGTLPVLAVASATAITSTPEELNALDGITAVVGEINALDIGSTAVGTAVASKAVILDSNKDYTGIRNLTITGELDAATGDFSGAVDVAGATTTVALTASGLVTAGAKIDLNGTELILDADGDTSLTADTDDQIHVRIAGADDFKFIANHFNVLSGSNLTFATDSIAYFGDGNNLQISSDGTNALIKESGGSGNLVLAGQTVRLMNAANNEIMLEATNDAGVDIRHNNVTKLVTTATGIDVTGTVTSDGASLDGAVVINDSSADVDFRIESNSNDNMFNVQGADRVGVGSIADLGVGLHIRTADSGASVHATGDDLVIEGSGNAGLSILSGNTSEGVVYFGDAQDNNVGRIVYDHNLNHIALHTSGAEQVRLHSNGVLSASDGIALGVGTANTASNVLDDYEEGTYTPAMTVNSGSLTVHGSHNTLAYTKIGRVVHVQGEMRFSAVSSPSGNFSVSLPFAVADLAEGSARSTSGAIGQSSFGGTPNQTYYLRITSEGSTTAFFATHNSGSDTGVNANQVSTSTEMIVSFTFIAA